MALEPLQDQECLAEALLDIVPRLLRRLGADVPLEGEAAGWREVAELRATPGQLSLLAILVEHERCTMQELAEHLAVAPSTATAMVKRLLAQGYVERAHDEADWRTVWVKPTEAGSLAVSVFQRARLASLECRLDHLSDEERASIVVALPALRHLIEV
jgi:MarR family transcriptional regulator, organic hydroperoxide resistance regulator